MWSGVEDETEYETFKWRSSLLTMLFDLRLGGFLIYTTAHMQRAGCIVCVCAAYRMSELLYAHYVHKQAHNMQIIIFTSISCRACKPLVTSYQLTVFF